MVLSYGDLAVFAGMVLVLGWLVSWLALSSARLLVGWARERIPSLFPSQRLHAQSARCWSLAARVNHRLTYKYNRTGGPIEDHPTTGHGIEWKRYWTLVRTADALQAKAYRLEKFFV